MPLSTFIQAKKAEIESLKKRQQEGNFPAPLEIIRPSFAAALQGEEISIIAEYKRASPSLGEINMHATPKAMATAYAKGGAKCISVLTEEMYFKGHKEFLSQAHHSVPSMPLLRKDFIFHPLQVLETAATPASALLLMVSLTQQQEEIKNLYELTVSLGLEAVVEVFNEEELRIARSIGARLIQVNARNLATMDITLDGPLQLAAKERSKKTNEIWICASGMHSAQNLHAAKEVGYDAVLVGTALMQAQDPEKALRELANY